MFPYVDESKVETVAPELGVDPAVELDEELPLEPHAASNKPATPKPITVARNFTINTSRFAADIHALIPSSTTNRYARNSFHHRVMTFREFFETHKDVRTAC